MGFGAVYKEIEELDKLDMDFEIVSVSGNNKKLKTKIDSMETRKKNIQLWVYQQR